MLTYQWQDRIFRLTEQKRLTFPNLLKLEMKLSPPEVFGSGDGYSRLVVFSRKASLLWNANTGRVTCRSNPHLEPLEVIVESPSTRFVLKGNLAEYQCQCEDIDHLTGTLEGFQYAFPAFLNIEFPDPPTVEYIKGKLGDVDFRWEHSEMAHSFRPLTGDALEKHVILFFEALPIFGGTGNRRFLAAVHYFYISSRLLVAGHSQWELMAESVLNLCKSLEILFGGTMDDTRGGLKTLGYSREEIEGDFIPLLILRNSLDIAHPRVALFKRSELKTLYMYLFNTEDRFRKLLKCVIARLQEGTFTLREKEDLKLSMEEQKKMDLLMAQLRSRNPLVSRKPPNKAMEPTAATVRRKRWSRG